MINPYQLEQSNKQAKLLELHPQWFDNDKGEGMFRGNSYPFILTNLLSITYLRGLEMMYSFI